MTRWAGAAAAIAIAIAIVRLMTSDGAAPDPAAASAIRPARPPGPGERRQAPAAEPAMPVLTVEQRAALFEQVKGSDRPGEAAFRVLSDRYVDDNRALAERQARMEGLTIAEVRELTYFGLAVLATQRVSDVEDIIGRALTDDQRGELGDLMQSSNAGFRDAMRTLVARGAGERERWDLIRATESRYFAELGRITGLDAERFDDLLAGNLALPGAPARGEPPTGEPASGGQDDLAPATRPGGR